MKRRLIVMRHAKSSWTSDAPNDHARPLNKRGRRDAPRVALRLRELDWLPTEILSSDSARTTETVQLLNLDVPTHFMRGLYHAGFEEVRAALAGLANEIDAVMVVGHNPGWQEVVEHYSGEEVVMKTACAALLEHDAARWAEASHDAGGWTLVDVIHPRELPE